MTHPKNSENTAEVTPARIHGTVLGGFGLVLAVTRLYSVANSLLVKSYGCALSE